MLEHLPSAIGRGLRRVRPGWERIVMRRPGLVTGAPSLVVGTPG